METSESGVRPPTWIASLTMIAAYTAKPTGAHRLIAIRTERPERTFALALTPDQVTFAEAGADVEPDLTLPAEAFVRLVYGRLDPEHTPSAVTGDLAALADLRSVYPGP